MQKKKIHLLDKRLKLKLPKFALDLPQS